MTDWWICKACGAQLPDCLCPPGTRDEFREKKGEEYQPELGQLVFGQPWQELECSVEVECALKAIRYTYISLFPEKEDPFGNTGASFICDKFKAHAYSWSDDMQEYNFAWRDVRVSWYKYLGRGMTMNREMSNSEIRTMVLECVRELCEFVE